MAEITLAAWEREGISEDERVRRLAAFEAALDQSVPLMTPSEETRGEKRIGAKTREDWADEYLADRSVGRRAYLFGRLLSAAFSREAEGDSEAGKLREALRELADAFEARMGDWENAEFHEAYNVARALLTAEGQKKGEG